MPSLPLLPKARRDYYASRESVRRKYLRGVASVHSSAYLPLCPPIYTQFAPVVKDSVLSSLDMDASEVQAAIDKGSLQAIFQDSPGRVQQPVVQCVQIKPMSQSNGEATERYRVVFSDTQNYVQTMLATSINDEIHQDRLKKGAVVQLVSYQANLVKGKRYAGTMSW